MRTIFSLILLALGLFSCESKIYFFDKNHIIRLSDTTFSLVNKYSGLTLFVKSTQNKYAITTIDYLNYIYKTNTKYKKYTYLEFLNESLNNNLEIDFKGLNKTQFNIFTIDSTIKNEYNNTEFSLFFNKYSKKSKFDNNKYYLNNNINIFDKIMSVSYYLYINGYQVESDDYIGKYVIIKRNDLFK